MDAVSAIILSVLLSLLAMTIGALVTYLVTRHYYEAASEDLKKEAALLRQANKIIALALQNAGLADLVMDEGNIVGLNYTVKLTGPVHGHRAERPELKTNKPFN